MPDTPLNPDALEAAADAVIDASFGQELPEAPIDLARAAVSAYLAVAQPVLDETALANLIAWKSLPFGATQFVKLDANAAHKVIELLRPHLALAQPEVTDMDGLRALPADTILEASGKMLDGTFHQCMIRKLPDFVTGTDGTVDPGFECLSYTSSQIVTEVFFPARVLYRPTEGTTNGRE